MYFSPEVAREIAKRNRCVAEYVPGSGARCIYCGEWGDDLQYGTKRLVSGVIRRYHICPCCSNKFVSDQRPVVTVIIVEDHE